VKKISSCFGGGYGFGIHWLRKKGTISMPFDVADVNNIRDVSQC